MAAGQTRHSNETVVCCLRYEFSRLEIVKSIAQIIDKNFLAALNFSVISFLILLNDRSFFARLAGRRR